MRRVPLCVAVLSLLVVPFGAAADLRPKPSLVVTDRSPLTLRGSFFRSWEWVRVTIVDDESRRTRSTRATRTGSFRVVFPATSVVDFCGFEAFATGARGSRAAAKLPMPLCPPRLQPRP